VLKSSKLLRTTLTLIRSNQLVSSGKIQSQARSTKTPTVNCSPSLSRSTWSTTRWTTPCLSFCPRLRCRASNTRSPGRSSAKRQDSPKHNLNRKMPPFSSRCSRKCAKGRHLKRHLHRVHQIKVWRQPVTLPHQHPILRKSNKLQAHRKVHSAPQQRMQAGQICQIVRKPKKDMETMTMMRLRRTLCRITKISHCRATQPEIPSRQVAALPQQSGLIKVLTP
jgi:hypothetical protein